MHSVKSLHDIRDRPPTSYSFSHMTLQEFLAARYWSQLPHLQLTEILQREDLFPIKKYVFGQLKEDSNNEMEDDDKEMETDEEEDSEEDEEDSKEEEDSEEDEETVRKMKRTVRKMKRMKRTVRKWLRGDVVFQVPQHVRVVLTC